MRILPSTLMRQQSFCPLWLTNTVNIPSGFITDCQFTTTSTEKISIRRIANIDGDVDIVFTQGSDICAYGKINNAPATVVLNVANSVLSATLEVAELPGIGTSIELEVEESCVNPALVNVVNTTTPSEFNLILVQDGIKTQSVVDKNISVILEGNLTGDLDMAGGLVINLPDEELINFTKVGAEVIAPKAVITSVNGVSPRSGHIDISIQHEGSLLPATRRADNWVELDSTFIPFCPGFSDTIDTYISPKSHSGYLPLDDVYDKKTGRRNTELILGDKYGDPTSEEKQDLMSIDTNIDFEGNI